jgi:hypothetical protein
MEIKLHSVKVRELVKDYQNNDEDGVKGYNGKLDIRPKYQREFVYNDTQQKAVIDTILKGYPLNVIYWVKNDENSFEVLDGQQRILSICEYVNNKFSIFLNNRPVQFHNLQETQNDIAEKILNYELMVFIVEDGTESEKLEWFKTINIAGEKLTDQELRNAVYTGTWLSDAKLKFSKSNCQAYQLANNYLTGTPIRQDYLETAIKWISKNNIEKYMSDNQQQPNANLLWNYFSSVINWIQTTFITYRREMQGLNWGELYDTYKDTTLDSKKLEEQIKILMQDEDVTNRKGIYEYVLTGNENKLNIRAFSDRDKRSAYEKQKGKCPICKKNYEIQEMQADHITPWSKGGKTLAGNCKMLCAECNRRKSNI